MDGQAPRLWTSGDSDGAWQGTRVVVAPPPADGDKARRPKPGTFPLCSVTLIVFFTINVKMAARQGALSLEISASLSHTYCPALCVLVWVDMDLRDQCLG